MSYEPVDLFVKDSTPAGLPLSGVLVKVFSQDGKLVFTETTSGSNGQVSLLLASGFTYQLRFFKNQVKLQNPLYITVQSAPARNVFDVVGEVFTPPTPTDARLCLARGYFRRPDGSPANNVDIHFIAQFDPVLLDGAAMVVERVSIRTDKTGFGQVTLVRNGKYAATVEGFEDCQRVICVPDLSSCNLPDLLFPVVDAITFDITAPFSVPFNQTLIVTPNVVLSSGFVVSGPDVADVNWTSSDPSIFAVAAGSNTLVLTGNAPGTAQLIAQRLETGIIRIPNTPINGVPVDVTVS